jgi:hypothetical protein
MTTIENLNRILVLAHAATTTTLSDLGHWLAARADLSDERGDVEARTITIAVMAALAIAIGVIITTKVTDKANDISLD